MSESEIIGVVPMNSRFLFLDFDGVLNGLEDLRKGVEIDPLKVLLINQVCEATDAYVVISSAWRHMYPIKWLEFVLDAAGLKYPRIHGITPTYDSGFRGEEVNAYIVDLGVPVKYAIVDDNDDFYDWQKERLVLTNVKTGITPKDADRLIELLS